MLILSHLHSITDSRGLQNLSLIDTTGTQWGETGMFGYCAPLTDEGAEPQIGNVTELALGPRCSPCQNVSSCPSLTISAASFLGPWSIYPMETQIRGSQRYSTHSLYPVQSTAILPIFLQASFIWTLGYWNSNRGLQCSGVLETDLIPHCCWVRDQRKNRH